MQFGLHKTATPLWMTQFVAELVTAKNSSRAMPSAHRGMLAAT